MSAAHDLVWHLHPSDLLEDRSVVMVDIRPDDERFGEIGFIPGSRWFDAARFDANPAQEFTDLGAPSRLALICLSGRRSGELAQRLSAALGVRVGTLDGGVLGWRAAGLPTCGVSEVDAARAPQVDHLDEIPRALISCFLAESVEMMLELGDMDFDPLAAVERVFEEALHGESPSQDNLIGAVERLAQLAWQRGHDPEHITRNTDLMLYTITHTPR